MSINPGAALTYPALRLEIFDDGRAECSSAAIDENLSSSHFGLHRALMRMRAGVLVTAVLER